MLKNSSIFAVYVPINLSIKLGFISVNGFRENYFVDVLHMFTKVYVCVSNANPLQNMLQVLCYEDRWH